MTDESQLNKLSLAIIQRLYESDQQLIYVADRKVAALLLINAVLISFSATWNLMEYSRLVRMIILLAILCAAVSTIMYLLAIIPRISDQASKSILHYKGILRESRNQYVSKMLEIKDQDIVIDYLNTVYSLSFIQMKKNQYLRVGSELLIASIILLAISFLLHNGLRT